MNLRTLPVFGTTRPALQCTRFLLSQIQNGSLWLNEEIPIHAEHIHRLTGLSQNGADVSAAGQTSSKRARKSGDADLYTKYGTRRGGKGAKIDLINKPEIRFACYLIASKTMRHYTKGECTLDTISIAEHCIQGAKLNWCSFVLKELFAACEENYKRTTSFIYGYLILAFAMWKWHLPPVRVPTETTVSQPLAMKYTPWQVSTDPSTKQVNAEAFQAWYGMMTDVVTNQQRVPRHLLDEYSEQVWFGVSHRHTFLRQTCVSDTTFHMAPLWFQLNDDTFHREVSSWPGVVKHVRDGVTRYNFEGMLPA